MERSYGGGILGKTWALLRQLKSMGIPGHAANAGYFIVLSVFPMLVLILSALRYTSLDAGDLLQLLSGFLPQALMAPAEKLIIGTYAHTSTAMMGVSAVGALWSASRGTHGILMGLNAVYEVQEDRGYLHTRALSVGYTFAFLLLLLLTLVANVFTQALQQWLEGGTGLLLLLSRLLQLRFLLLLVLQTALFCAMFTVLPNRKTRFSRSLPGALLASIGWMVFTELFSVYVEHFSGYSGIYGSVYAVALSMLWLYFCLSILFYGGALNRLIAGKNVEKM